MKAEVFNLEGKYVGEIEVPEEVFKRTWNASLVHQIYVAQEGNRRKPLAHAKDRSEVRGGGKKPWRQKGTGRARHGSIRSPLWKGGGVTHGPRKDRNFSQKVNRKMKRAAINSLLSKKFVDGEVKFVDSLTLGRPKTKELYQALTKFLSARKKNSLSSVLIPAKGNKMIPRAASNIPKVKSVPAASLNVRDLLTHKNVIIDRQAIPEFITSEK